MFRPEIWYNAGRKPGVGVSSEKGTTIAKRIISYKKPWKLLIDRGLNKVELQKMTGLYSATITKLGKRESVTTRAIMSVCNALKCDTSDIMEMEDAKSATDGKKMLAL